MSNYNTPYIPDEVRSSLIYELQADPQHGRRTPDPHRDSEGWCCPLCGSGNNKDGAVKYYAADSKWHCHACGQGGDIVDYYAAMNGRSKAEARQELITKYGTGITAAAPARPVTTKPAQLADYTAFFKKCNEALNSDAGTKARDYLENKRAIPIEIANQYGIGYDKEKDRIIIPCGKHYFIGRLLHETENGQRYYDAAGKGKTIFNADALKGENPVFITEGAFDSLSIITATGAAVATNSTAGIDKLIEQIKANKKNPPLILCMDKDESGRAATARLKDELDKLNIEYYEADICGEAKDPNEAFAADPITFIDRVIKLTENPAVQAIALEKEEYNKTSAAHYLKSFWDSTRAHTEATPCGFSLLDDELDGGFYEGLYIVGAISSLGKTTLCLQIADQIAKAGKDVLVFSLEMSRYELIAKSLSRLTFQMCSGATKNAKTVRSLTNPARRAEFGMEERILLQDATKAYREYAEHLYIREGMGDISAAHIREEVEKATRAGKRPFVLVDYLQIMAASDPRMTDKQAMDKNVMELKRISRDYKIPILAVSSFNRDSYNASARMTAFKESGAIEYSSDVLLALQPVGMKEGTKEQDKIDNAQTVASCKEQSIRHIELVILKNRNGKTGGKIHFYYTPMFNHFEQIGTEIKDNGKTPML